MLSPLGTRPADRKSFSALGLLANRWQRN